MWSVTLLGDHGNKTRFSGQCGRRRAVVGASIFRIVRSREAKGSRAVAHPPAAISRTVSSISLSTARSPEKDCTGAIAKAIAACSTGRRRTGGGASREFLTGAIHLKSNVNLHLAEGAILRFSTDPNSYLPAGLHALGKHRVHELLAADLRVRAEQHGGHRPGTLDGQADNDHWWPWKGNAKFGFKKGEPEQQPIARRVGRDGREGRAGERARVRAKATTCVPISSSRIAATTSSSKASPSCARPCGK